MRALGREMGGRPKRERPAIDPTRSTKSACEDQGTLQRDTRQKEGEGADGLGPLPHWGAVREALPSQRLCPQQELPSALGAMSGGLNGGWIRREQGREGVRGDVGVLQQPACESLSKPCTSAVDMRTLRSQSHCPDALRASGAWLPATASERSRPNVPENGASAQSRWEGRTNAGPTKASCEV